MRRGVSTELTGEDAFKRALLLFGCAIVEVEDPRPRRPGLVVAVAHRKRDRLPGKVDLVDTASSISHDSTPAQTRCVERPPGTPSIRRHGQIASQLHDSKYVPLICQLIPRIIPACAAYTRPGPIASSDNGHIPASILARP
jgi:hypothetical protein